MSDADLDPWRAAGLAVRDAIREAIADDSLAAVATVAGVEGGRFTDGEGPIHPRPDA